MTYRVSVKGYYKLEFLDASTVAANARLKMIKMGEGGVPTDAIKILKRFRSTGIICS